ncbi:glucosamine-6-phosphate deaminase [Mycoplasmoides fastidiosum]|uniref:Glucosamine-6-phosphate deaminase n=1 Tax=Mycoplasmoides fastidiosum TaxID=92758 RepID=A0ABU0LYT9_9BACT|nr:glucosamine-6-phosphate deaminase [Mycoplasmoides fastidiosum]MDQ0513854.1 glucosamine-6-phosphate deaminase [Mycoplasmoides fastidiosum]UUD37731.1 glucosamine-6-phosphate deaminase [Mycoplasmoides fastidiosum]
MKIIIFDQVDDLQRYCAQLFLDKIHQNPKVTLGFATGISPIPAYQYLIQDHQENQTSWKEITTFNLDEFLGINKEHPESFIQQMKNNLFDHIDLNTNKINIPNCEANDPFTEAMEYENKIINHGGIDFQYISLEINGHMAYNEPGTSFTSKTHVVDLTSETITDLITKNKFSSPEEAPKQAITMGVQTLLKHTKEAIMVAFGKHKAIVAKKMLEEDPNSQITASFLQLHPNCTFILDKEAASLLSEQTLAMAKKGSNSVT